MSNWDSFLTRAALVYLLFVAIRTSLLLLFSFADRYFQRVPKPITEFPLISIIVPCYNEQDVVDNAVRSLARMDYPNFEILLVDDGSSDLTLTVAKEMKNYRLRVIYQKNQGKAAALNRAISEALGEYVMCMDADSMLTRNTLRDGLKYFADDPKLAAVAGCVNIGNAHKNMLLAFQKLEYVTGLNLHKAAQSFLSMVTIVPGPVGLFKKAVVNEIGGYRTSTYAEDADLSIRILLNGYHIVYCKDMIAITEAPEDYTSLLKQRYRWSRGMLQSIRLNREAFFHPFSNTRNFLIILYVTVETAIIPSANFLFAMAFIVNATLTGKPFLAPFFLQLTVLDVILTTYSVFVEGNAFALIMMSFVNRITFGLSLEVVRFFSIIDETAGLPMSWNKLQRKGL